MSSDSAEVEFTDLSKFRRKDDAPPFPLVGIVGQQVMKRAILLAASNPRVGNIILIGEAGTGKSTAIRGLRAMLPEVEAVNGCGYNCDPRDNARMCPECKSSVSELNHSPRRLPLLELPIGTSERRIFGGFDTQSRLKPGYVGQANRGYLLIARANLLDPDLLDRILDISDAGIHKSDGKHGHFTHPARFNVLATMNPEDGELESEVMNRFSMSAKVQSIKDIEERIEIVRRVEAYRQDPADFVNRNRREMEALENRLKRARDLVNRVDMPKKVVEAINRVLKNVGHEEEHVRKAFAEAAMANAAFNDRVWVTLDDLAEVGDLVLGTRMQE